MRVFRVGDQVAVQCEGLATLRALCPDMPPNHHGEVTEVLDSNTLLIEFPDGQAVPYSVSECRLRE